MTYNSSKTNWMVALLAGALVVSACGPDENNENNKVTPITDMAVKMDMTPEEDMTPGDDMTPEVDMPADMPADLCATVTCDAPAPVCDGNTSVAKTSTCNPATGMCEEADGARTDCAGATPVCMAGTCVADGGEDPEPTCENYCDRIMTNCTGDDAQYGSAAECLSYCNDVGGWDAGTKGDTDGDTIACRIYHGGAPAEADASLHCDHAGPSGGNVCGSWCDVYCNLTVNNCDGDNSLYNNDAECAAACADFETDGEVGDLNYDTVQCRIYHLGAPAAADPVLHCPHGGEEPTAFCVGAPEDFIFSTDAPDTYTRHDRIGMPAVSTALIADKPGYNDQDPIDDIDANNPYVAEIVASLTFLHTALDTQLTNLGLVPCDVNTCVAQGGPLILPDTISVDTSAASGFPNGRRLQDPVMDVTLAVILLDLSAAGQTAVSLVGVLNPTQNDLGVEGAFLPAFPYLHPPHTP